MVQEIRANAKTLVKIKKVSILSPDVTLTVDETVEQAVVMLNEDGKSIPGVIGNDVVINFAKYGYVRVLKSCPLRHRKCIAEKCALYLIQGGIGDCSIRWAGMPDRRRF